MSTTDRPAQRERTLPKRYRPEIEGVRAIAAMLVASYHLWSGRVSGGVDVFFVMSGFLITTTLFGHVDRHGRVMAWTYFSRLLVRLLPAALTVLLTVVVLTRWVLPESMWGVTARESVASALYSQNWYLALTSTDYLGQFEEKTPVQHFWAMSVQGQFYLAWFFVFCVIVALVSLTRGHRRTVAGWVFAVIFVSSLAYSVWFTAVNQPVAYFSSVARVWEFALGGLGALLLSRQWHAPRLRWVFGWVGFAGLFATGLLLQVSTVFPGYAALLPTLSALMILFAADSGLRGSATALLSHRWLVWLGGISYGLYLWHWPLLTFDRHLRGASDTSILRGLAIIAISIVLAWLTFRFIETPIGRWASRSPHSRRLAVGTLLAGIGVLALSAQQLSATATVRADTRLDEVKRTDLYAFVGDPCRGALAATAPDPSCAKDEAVFPHPSVARKAPQERCRRLEGTGDLRVCEFGVKAEQARATVVLTGDSHAKSLIPTLYALAERQRWHGFEIVRPGCQPSVVQRANSQRVAECEEWNDLVTAWLLEHADQAGPVDALFTIAASGHEGRAPDGSVSTDAVTEGFRATWAERRPATDLTVVLRDTPRLNGNVMTCVEEFLSTANDRCSRPVDSAVKPDAQADLAEHDGADSTTVVDLTDVFCEDRRCVPVIGGLFAYTDPVHLSAFFAASLAPVLEARLPDALTPSQRRVLLGDS